MKPSEYSIILTRQIAASPRVVYAAWTDQEQMTRWLGKVSADVRVGGNYRFESPAPGGKTFVYTGRYLALDENRCVRQSFLAGEPDPAKPNPYSDEFIEIRLTEVGPSHTELTFTNGWDGEPLNAEAVDAARAAWSGWLEQMEASLCGRSL